MALAYANEDRGAAYAAPLAKLRAVLLVVALCFGFALVSPRAPSVAGAEAYTEPYFEYISSAYSIGISLDPVCIDYISIDPKSRGEQRVVLAYVGKPSTLWLGIGGWGTHMPTKPSRVKVLEEEGRTVLAISDIEFVGFLKTTFGEIAPVRADWVFTFYEDFFDMELTWRIQENVDGLQEAGWALNIDLPRYGDSEEAVRLNQDVNGYPKWIVWYGPDLGVAAAHKEGSTNLRANRWYGNLPSSYVIVHTWWKPGGSGIDWGTYPGGIWRVGFFGGEKQLDAAWALYGELNGID